MLEKRTRLGYINGEPLSPSDVFIVSINALAIGKRCVSMERRRPAGIAPKAHKRVALENEDPHVP